MSTVPPSKVEPPPYLAADMYDKPPTRLPQPSSRTNLRSVASTSGLIPATVGSQRPTVPSRPPTIPSRPSSAVPGSSRPKSNQSTAKPRPATALSSTAKQLGTQTQTKRDSTAIAINPSILRRQRSLPIRSAIQPNGQAMSSDRLTLPAPKPLAVKRILSSQNLNDANRPIATDVKSRPKLTTTSWGSRLIAQAPSRMGHHNPSAAMEHIEEETDDLWQTRPLDQTSKFTKPHNTFSLPLVADLSITSSSASPSTPYPAVKGKQRYKSTTQATLHPSASTRIRPVLVDTPQRPLPVRPKIIDPSPLMPRLASTWLAEPRESLEMMKDISMSFQDSSDDGSPFWLGNQSRSDPIACGVTQTSSPQLAPQANPSQGLIEELNQTRSRYEQAVETKDTAQTMARRAISKLVITKFDAVIRGKPD
ncbi:hypothetical protein BCR39DRAFT_558318 [Naematelia encephala]|uniref:Uncharacterized protein n=1 Tax=Naematelia encephala TaxID=71784 RepID=A0A1Y2B8Y9_9TREE|nr:hypothetical protein BCR39DRAFT_558318 [Naematelia encephala]